MKTLYLKQYNGVIEKTINITGSKSESNRLLILKQIYPNLIIENLSNSDDTYLLNKALSQKQGVIDIRHAGTAMRFLTGFLSTRSGLEVTLTGSKRMQQRPISILVEALRNLGADITYLNKEGFAPLLIKGRKLQGGTVYIDGNVSSQYISSLLLIASNLEKGLTLHFKGNITSVPYIKMTLALLKNIGVECSFKNKIIFVNPLLKIKDVKVIVESDWSSASYYYSLTALNEKTQITLSSYKKNSLQGDSILAKIYENLGVMTRFKKDTMQLFRKHNFNLPKQINLDLINAPDIAQTIAVSCFGLGISCNLKGLHTLKIKETNRLTALQTELTKLGADVKVTEDSLHLSKRKHPIKQNISIATYHDHRMAMAFAPLFVKANIIIEDFKVVSKSYPKFWEDWEI